MTSPGQTPSPIRRPTWLMIAPHFDGHHFTYLEHFVAGALARGIGVVVGTGDDEEQGRRTKAALEAKFGNRVAVVTAAYPSAPSGGPRLIALAVGELRRLGFLRVLYRQARRTHAIDHVFLPYLDWTLFAIAVAGSPFGDTRYSGITMRQRFHLRDTGVTVAYERMNALKKQLFLRLLRDRGLATVYTNDPTLAEYFQRGSTRSKVVHIADPSDPVTPPARADARRQLGLPAEGCVVLAYGYLDRRKGVPSLLAWLGEAVARCSVHLLLVGQQASEITALLSSSAEAKRLASEGRLHVINELVPEDAEPLYFGACDIVWLGYERFEMMSGVLVKAAQYGRTAVFREYGLIAHYARRHGVPVQHAESCAGALSVLPAGFAARTFDAQAGAPALPDHAWSNALRLVFE